MAGSTRAGVLQPCRSRAVRGIGGLALALVAATALVWPGHVLAVCGDGQIDPGEKCDDGNTFGGDGCAANCTLESLRPFVFDTERSMAMTQFRNFAVSFQLAGQLGITTGEPGSRGVIPFVIRKADTELVRVQVPGLGCACTISEIDEAFGPGNVAQGTISCGTTLRGPDFVLMSRDHNTDDVDPDCRRGSREGPDRPHEGVCNGPVEITTGSEPGPRGSVLVQSNFTIHIIQDGGTCAEDPTDPAKGPDGIPCTEDDPPETVEGGSPVVIQKLEFIGTSGTVQVAIEDADNIPGAMIAKGQACGGAPCAVEVTGKPFNCDAIINTVEGGADTGAVAIGLPLLDNFPFPDTVVTIRLVAQPNATPTPTPTFPVTPTLTPTVTRTPSPTPTTSLCAGDCDGNGEVTINELVQAVAIALGRSPTDACRAADANADGTVAINELVAAVRSALGGCS